MSKIQDLFVREKDGYFECGFCQTSFFTLIMFKFHLQTKHTSVTQPVELQNPSHVQAPVKNNNTKKSEKLPILQNSSLPQTIIENNNTTNFGHSYAAKFEHADVGKVYFGTFILWPPIFKRAMPMNMYDHTIPPLP